jgi:hypothetical protein
MLIASQRRCVAALPTPFTQCRQRYFNINWIQLATTWATLALFLVALISL